MTGPLLHGRQTCSMIPVGVEVDLTAPIRPRHLQRRAENPPRTRTIGGKRRARFTQQQVLEATEYATPRRVLIGCPCPCHVVPGVSHVAPCCYPVPS